MRFKSAAFLFWFYFYKYTNTQWNRYCCFGMLCVCYSINNDLMHDLLGHTNELNWMRNELSHRLSFFMNLFVTWRIMIYDFNNIIDRYQVSILRKRLHIIFSNIYIISSFEIHLVSLIPIHPRKGQIQDIYTWNVGKTPIHHIHD